MTHIQHLHCSKFYQLVEHMPVSSVNTVGSLGTEVELEVCVQAETVVLQQCMVVGMADTQQLCLIL